MASDQISKKLVVLGTGGTIAGTAENASDNIGYTAAQVGVAQLLDAVPGLPALLHGHQLLSEQVAQVDSKDMRFDIWQALAQRVVQHLAQPDVSAVIITHGTDTLEETAYFLHAVLPREQVRHKPVVLTCAMRPASAQNPDGPQNLMDAVTVALTPGAGGVVAVCAGTVHTALDVQKAHTYKLDAFSSGDAGALAYVEENQLRLLRNWPLAQEKYKHIAIENIAKLPTWPRVEIVMSYAGCTGEVVDALLRPGADGTLVRGLVVAATGNGTIHQALEAALRRAEQAGVRVVRATRCANGRVLPAVHSEFAHSQGLSPVKARIALMLELINP
ncbi:asparaginase [Rhodoferax sp.]|uniref:asparaginase n=1 Tax=Rhodoferax sp. TaxID=50421 RepID=UPI002602A486|nr:asparaginase [Rhodoferax sp.]MDD2923886.1 asparaginase [Rhodoferax sp.]